MRELSTAPTDLNANPTTTTLDAVTFFEYPKPVLFGKRIAPVPLLPSVPMKASGVPPPTVAVHLSRMLAEP